MWHVIDKKAYSPLFLKICSSSFSLPFSRFSPFPAAEDSGRVIISVFGLYFQLPAPPARSPEMLSGSHHLGLRSAGLFTLTFDPTRPPFEPERGGRFSDMCSLEHCPAFSVPLFLHNPTLIKRGVSFSCKMVSLKIN